MQESGVKRVVELMTAMAAGDAAAAFAMYDEFGAVIRRVLRSYFAERHVLAVASDELDGLTLDAVLALHDAAPAWRPDGGAMPWTWAERRLRALVNDHLGPATRELGDTDGTAPALTRPDDSDELARLERAAAGDEMVRLLVEALDQACSRRDAQLFLSMRAQTAGGDPSPSHTVAARHGMKPPAVRQAAARARRSLHAVVQRDDRFVALRGLPLLEP